MLQPQLTSKILKRMEVDGGPHRGARDPGHSHLSPGLSLTRQLLRETIPGSFCAALGMGRPWSSMSWKERRLGGCGWRVAWRSPPGSARAAQAMGLGPCSPAELVLKALAASRSVLKKVSLSQSGCSLQFNRPMSVLHGAPVPMFSSQNQPSRRCSPAASPLSPSPPHLQAKPHEGPVTVISKGPVADAAPSRRIPTPLAPAPLGRVERTRS